MIGVDRLDYSKGIALRLEAYERFLAAHPNWHGKITYLQITPKSRSQIKEYSEMESAVNAMAGRINGNYSDASWSPMRYVNRPYSRTALSGLYRGARVGLVTPLRDGMNLVAKEYVAAQDAADPGVLILSRFAGAAAEFKEGALRVNPYDPDAVGAAIARAMAMPLAERKSRHAALYAALLRNDISQWGDKFLAALMGTKQFRSQGKAARPRRRPAAYRASLKRGRTDGQAPWPARSPPGPGPIPSPHGFSARATTPVLCQARQQAEMIDQRQPDHRQHQRELRAQHREIGRRIVPGHAQQHHGGVDHAGHHQQRHR